MTTEVQMTEKWVFDERVRCHRLMTAALQKLSPADPLLLSLCEMIEHYNALLRWVEPTTKALKLTDEVQATVRAMLDVGAIKA